MNSSTKIDKAAIALSNSKSATKLKSFFGFNSWSNLNIFRKNIDQSSFFSYINRSFWLWSSNWDQIRSCNNRDNNRYLSSTFWRIYTSSMWTSCTSTNVTKFLSTFTSHSWASIISLDPIITLRTLLKFGSFDKFNEILVIFIESIVDFVLGTSHSLMINASTFQAVVFLTSWTSIVIKPFLKLKNSCTSCSWTPSSWAIFFYKFIKTKFLEFLF